jgi:tRNA-dihydrouridine synthase
MDGVTDAAFRRLVAQMSPPDITFTEFTNVNDICLGPGYLLDSLLYDECERPVVAQIYGKDPALFYQAAHVVCELGFDGLDINMGCPSRNVASSGAGAGLIRTPDLAKSLMQASRQGVADWAAGQSLREAGLKASREDLVGSINQMRADRAALPRRAIPVSVKTRLGYDDVVVEDWVEHLLEEQPVAITIHGRTLQQMYRGAADWSAIERAARLIRQTDTLLLGNGDLQSMHDVVQRVRASGVHGVLVGRGTLGAPWFFRGKESARRAVREPHASPGCDLDHPVSLADRFDAMQQHARQFEALFGTKRFPRMRKHLAWYCKAFPHAAAMRDRMVRVNGSEDVTQLVTEYLTAASSARLGSDPAASSSLVAITAPST